MGARGVWEDVYTVNIIWDDYNNFWVAGIKLISKLNLKIEVKVGVRLGQNKPKIQSDPKMIPK